ncbi:MarR family winged helix-turn-helix transcriptional regulator [Roseiterribacter gracilis]|uniref:Transcriptional regulator n=1 Tax=Roseiterribacter gracilis TaxID=2812848 RepID=A0A8S8XDS6_9PROT|nr:transcriptional regulator [Rhodospirillales bacterium TMPK1]
MTKPKKSTAKAAKNKGVEDTADRAIDYSFLPDLLGFNIRRVQIELWRDFVHKLDDEQFRSGEFSALALIVANPGISQTELARALAIDKAHTVALLDDLEKNGWAARTRSVEDRRRHTLAATPAGRKALVRLRKSMIEHEQKFCALYSPKELQTLLSLLQRLYTR